MPYGISIADTDELDGLLGGGGGNRRLGGTISYKDNLDLGRTSGVVEDLKLGRTSGDDKYLGPDGTSGGGKSWAQEVIRKSIHPDFDILSSDAGGWRYLLISSSSSISTPTGTDVKTSSHT